MSLEAQRDVRGHYGTTGYRIERSGTSPNNFGQIGEAFSFQSKNKKRTVQISTSLRPEFSSLSTLGKPGLPNLNTSNTWGQSQLSSQSENTDDGGPCTVFGRCLAPLRGFLTYTFARKSEPPSFLSSLPLLWHDAQASGTPHLHSFFGHAMVLLCVESWDKTDMDLDLGILCVSGFLISSTWTETYFRVFGLSVGP